MSMGTENQEVDLDNTDEIEVEIQDDTPEEDRGRPRKAESESELNLIHHLLRKKMTMLILANTASLCRNVSKS
jgi:hypothetical protein